MTTTFPHPFSPQYVVGKNLFLDEEIPKHCDWKGSPNVAARILEEGHDDHTRPHYWMHVEALFPHHPFPRSGVCIYKDIPNGSWCNRCHRVNMDRKVCEEYVFSDYSNSRCGKGASHFENGKHYCQTHNPTKVQARRSARDLKWKLEREASSRRYACNDAKNELGDNGLEILEWMEASNIHNEDEWAGQIYKKLMKSKEKLDKNQEPPSVE